MVHGEEVCHETATRCIRIGGILWYAAGTSPEATYSTSKSNVFHLERGVSVLFFTRCSEKLTRSLKISARNLGRELLAETMAPKESVYDSVYVYMFFYIPGYSPHVIRISESGNLESRTLL